MSRVSGLLDLQALGRLFAPAICEALMARWDRRASNTWNKHLSVLNSFRRLRAAEGLAVRCPGAVAGAAQGDPRS